MFVSFMGTPVTDGQKEFNFCLCISLFVSLSLYIFLSVFVCVIAHARSFFFFTTLKVYYVIVMHLPFKQLFFFFGDVLLKRK